MPSHLQLGELSASCNRNVKAGQTVGCPARRQRTAEAPPLCLVLESVFQDIGQELRPSFKGVQ